ncbi:MAG TPA: hypothetical protein VHR66_25570, partial [Gemmataceae bacterium]|nr:hypothetical protein [Gemmataceae bacterium]
TLVGLRTLLFVTGDEHARIYRQELERFREAWTTIADATGVLSGIEIPEPLFVFCDVDRLKLGASWAMLDQLRRGVLRRGSWPGLVLNQISPTAAAFVTQLGDLLRGHGLNGTFATEDLNRAGELALKYHDKANYVDLVRSSSLPLPLHVPTAVVSVEQFLAVRRWPELVELYRTATGDVEPAAVYVKSSRNSGGNIAARLTAHNFNTRGYSLCREVEENVRTRNVDFTEGVRGVRVEVDASPTLAPLGITDDRLLRYSREQAQRRTGIHLLIQREIKGPAGGGHHHGIGVSWYIDSAEDAHPIVTATQVYKDADRHHYLGSYLGPHPLPQTQSPEFIARVRNLCRLFAAEGWRGPISFDACLNEAEQYEFVYDCNPRLTAVYPMLTVCEALRRQGVSVQQSFNLGYRGEFVWEKLDVQLQLLKKHGLLFTKDHPSGAVVLPNLSRHTGYDVTLVNLDMPMIAEVMASRAFEQGFANPHVDRFYL